jgi:hypothetical protein
MEDKSEEQTLSRLLDLENAGQAERRAELTDQRYISLIHDPDSGRGFVLRHGTDETEGAEIPPGTEFWEYDSGTQAERAYDQLLAEARGAGELVDEDSTEDIGDSEAGGAEVRDLYADNDTDLQINPEGVEDEQPAEEP